MNRGTKWALLTAAVLLAGCASLTGRSRSSLQASGLVEAKEVSVAAEIGGQVDGVLVEEGDEVQVGETLFQLQRDLLLVELDAAKAAHRTILARLRQAKEAAELELINAEHALAELQEGEDMARAQAMQELAQAQQALDDAEYLRRVRQKGNRADQDALDAAEAKLILAENQVDQAKDRYDQYSGRDRDDPARAIALRALANARQDRDAALRSLNWLKGEPDEIDQAQLSADVALAEARVQQAERRLARMEQGPDYRALEAARARVEVAQATLDGVEAELAAEEENSTVRMLELQLEKSVVASPVAGVVLTRSVDQGEIVQPGLPVLVVGQLDELTITVYLPEDRYGAVRLGDVATVRVDSYPDLTFPATVTRIADEAEYTPRNVQTSEERQSTVYAVELAVEEREGRLKPGMPADVSFESP